MTEKQYLKKNKVCVACKHFRSYMASAGSCAHRDGQGAGMIDCMDTCHCSKFKYKPMPPMWIYNLRYYLITRPYYKIKSFLNPPKDEDSFSFDDF